jgi:hypothetical protein
MHAGGGTIIVPESSIARPGDVGKRARTFVYIFIPDWRAAHQRGQYARRVLRNSGLAGMRIQDGDRREDL